VIGSDETPGGGPESTPPNAESADPAPAAPVSPATAPAPTAPPAVSGPGVLRRTWEWFWRGRAMAELRRQALGPPRAAELLRRGWLSLEVAKRTLEPPERFSAGPPNAVAWELARQAVYWALRAARLLESGDDDTSVTLAALAESARPRLVAVAGGESELATLEPMFSGRTFVEEGELTPEEQGRRAHALSRFARALLTDLEQPRVRLDRLWFQRLWRCGGLFLLILLLVFGASLLKRVMERERDVAHGKPWHTSSVFSAIPGCTSPDQECAETPFYFFHTQDEDKPWLEIDLGQKRRIVGAIIENREDCCADRAVPLVISVSNDRRNWKEVARRTEIFGSWSPTFAPVSGRWVRVQVLKRTSLHLKRVSILR
jgi:hypothetical protein